MEKSFYYVVSSLSAVPLSNQLKLDGIPYIIETNMELPKLQVDELAIVFPELTHGQYDHVRRMFGDDGDPYPRQED